MNIGPLTSKNMKANLDSYRSLGAGKKFEFFLFCLFCMLETCIRCKASTVVSKKVFNLSFNFFLPTVSVIASTPKLFLASVYLKKK